MGLLAKNSLLLFPLESGKEVGVGVEELRPAIAYPGVKKVKEARAGALAAAQREPSAKKIQINHPMGSATAPTGRASTGAL